jgi:hypothetical protein
MPRTNTKDPVPTGNIISGDMPSPQATLTDVPSPGSSTDEFRAGLTSTTKKSTSKNKGKKPVKQQKLVMMWAARTQTTWYAAFYMSQTDPKLIQSRNLYAIDYLKDHEVTCDEFVMIWDGLKDNHQQLSQPTINTYSTHASYRYTFSRQPP